MKKLLSIAAAVLAGVVLGLMALTWLWQGQDGQTEDYDASPAEESATVSDDGGVQVIDAAEAAEEDVHRASDRYAPVRHKRRRRKSIQMPFGKRNGWRPTSETEK